MAREQVVGGQFVGCPVCQAVECFRADTAGWHLRGQHGPQAGAAALFDMQQHDLSAEQVHGRRANDLAGVDAPLAELLRDDEAVLESLKRTGALRAEIGERRCDLLGCGRTAQHPSIAVDDIGLA